MLELGPRFVDCFVAAADDVGLPADPEFRAALRAYMEWAVADVNEFHDARARASPPASVCRGGTGTAWSPPAATELTLRPVVRRLRRVLAR